MRNPGRWCGIPTACEGAVPAVVRVHCQFRAWMAARVQPLLRGGVPCGHGAAGGGGGSELLQDRWSDRVLGGRSGVTAAGPVCPGRPTAGGKQGAPFAGPSCDGPAFPPRGARLFRGPRCLAERHQAGRGDGHRRKLASRQVARTCGPSAASAVGLPAPTATESTTITTLLRSANYSFAELRRASCDADADAEPPPCPGYTPGYT